MDTLLSDPFSSPGSDLPVPPRHLRLLLDSDPDGVVMVGAALNGLCRNYLGMSDEETYEVELAVVEALSNVVQHAYGGRKGQPVSVEFRLFGEAIQVEVTDQGIPLSETDLLAARRLPSVDPLDLDSLAETGRGLYVVWSMMDEVRYASDGAVNRLTLTRRRAGRPRLPAPQPHWGGSQFEDVGQTEHRTRLEYLLRELQFARQIQCSILPGARRHSGVEVYAEVRPALHVGGDFYDIVPSQDGQGVTVLIGDVMGKGLPASLTMVMALTLLRETARRVSSPRELFTQANTLLYERLQAMIMWNAVSAAAVYVEPARRRMRYSKAGHENLLVYRAARGVVESLSGSGYFLGIFEDGLYEEYEVPLEPGDKVVLFTDGVTNARDLDGENFGTERLEELLAAEGSLSPRDLGERILKAVGAHQSVREPSDDVALVILGLEC